MFAAEGLLLSHSLLFPTTVSLVTCFLSVNTGGRPLLLLWISLLMCLSCILPTDIHPLWEITFNVYVCCTAANYFFSFFFLFSRESTSILRGTFQTLSREALLLDMTHEVRSPATAAVRSMSIDFICKTRNETVAVNAFCPISTFSVCDELGTLFLLP